MKTINDLYGFYKTMNPEVKDIYTAVLVNSCEIKSERKHGILNVYVWYSESTWVEIFEARLESNGLDNATGHKEDLRSSTLI